MRDWSWWQRFDERFMWQTCAACETKKPIEDFWRVDGTGNLLMKIVGNAHDYQYVCWQCADNAEARRKARAGLDRLIANARKIVK